MVSITKIIKLDKSKPLLDQDVNSVSFDKPLQVLLPGARGQVPNVDPAPTASTRNQISE